MRLLSAILLGFILFLSSAFAETVTGVDLTTQDAQTHVTISRGNPGPSPKIFQLGGENPRIVLDWSQGDWALSEQQINQTGHGAVRHIRYARQGNSGLRVVFDLAAGAKMMSHNISGTHIYLIVEGVQPTREQLFAEPRYFAGQVPYPRLRPQAIQPQPQTQTQTKSLALAKRKPVIVIDPGHGGRDPGAIGRGGTHEKSITLKAALELRRQLSASGRYTVLMTRSGDNYIAHEERLRIARAGGGDLFISIHADSTKTQIARGASVYTLADRAKNRSKGIVNTQNWIMDVDLTAQSDPVGDILVDLAQRKTKSQSDMFAELLITQLSGSTKLIGNSHRRAGYFVLLAPDVPAVLLELGFLSNSQDEKLLKSSAHRKKLMTSVVTAINTYFDTQKP